MSTMLIVGLLIAPILVVFVDAGSWKLHIQEVKRVQRNNTLGVLHDIYREVLNFDRTKYRGSGILWVPKKGCKATGEYLIGNCESGKYVYDTRESATAENLNLPFRLAYADGNSWTKGQYFKDVFSFGEKLHLEEKVTFGVGEEMRNRDQGILGLGNAINPRERGSSILHEAWRQKAIDAPIFTMYLRKCPDSEDCENRGIITIGSYDKEMCGDVVGDAKADPKCKSRDYEHELTVQNSYPLDLGKERISEPLKAVIDSGAPGIYMPEYMYKPLMESIRARRTKEGDYIVKCDADLDITLQINGQKYTVPRNQLLVNLHTGFCSMRLFPFNHPEDLWLLGTPFGISYCITHNFEAHTVEFASSLTRHE
ncbi:hypothetical protein M3Y95_01271000 [Aphelenchoides besseyi]|nr:hypothetical protein M3Y95_01271000 [Aphelenchoides besseyi]